MDEHIPGAVANELRRRGIDVLTSAEAGLLGAPDEAYVVLASTDSRVVVTQDRDFIRLYARHNVSIGTVYSEQGTRSIGQLVEGLLLIHDAMDDQDMAGRLEFL